MIGFANRICSFARWACLALVVAAAYRANMSHAALIAADSFDYSPVQSDLVGKNGGIGFNQNWFAGGFNIGLSTNFDIAQGSLSYPGLETSGNRVSSIAVGTISGVARAFPQIINSSQSTTRYLSFLVRPEGVVGSGAFNGFFGVYLDGNVIGSEPDLYVGKPGGGQLSRYVLEDRGGSNQIASSLVPVSGQTSLLVVKAQFTPGADLFTLYNNPVPGLAEPLTGTQKSLNIGTTTGLVIYSSGAFSIDEIRWGETFADVTPVPEPNTLLLGLLLAALGAVTVRRASS